MAFGEKNRSVEDISILNADIYWNPFPKSKKTAMMVPFASINYFTYDKNGLLDTSDIALSAGWRFVYVGREKSSLRFDTFAEVGYRYVDDEHYYYLNFSLDLIITAAIFLMTL
jgi:hypothetical protein